MNWRNPKIEKPYQDQKVFVMLSPHKWRGTIQESAMSVQICAGWFGKEGGRSCVDNNDEYGGGSDLYLFEEDYQANNEKIIAWLPEEEFDWPQFLLDKNDFYN